MPLPLDGVDESNEESREHASSILLLSKSKLSYTCEHHHKSKTNLMNDFGMVNYNI